MSQSIIYQENNAVKIVIPTGNLPIEEVISKDVPANVSYFIIDTSVLPTDRTFREAWELSVQGEVVEITTDMPQARLIHLNALRQIRNKKLEALDIEFMKALEQNDIVKQAEISDLKQQLRDLPETVDLDVFTTPEALKNFMPEILQDPV